MRFRPPTATTPLPSWALGWALGRGGQGTSRDASAPEEPGPDPAIVTTEALHALYTSTALATVLRPYGTALVSKVRIQRPATHGKR